VPLIGPLYIAIAAHFLYDAITGFAYVHLSEETDSALPLDQQPA
jgi:hypothetical protein